MSSQQTLLARNCTSPYAISGNRRRGHGLHDHLREGGARDRSRVDPRQFGRGGSVRKRHGRYRECDSIKVRDEADLTQAPDLIDALARLKAFRDARSASDVIDEGSGLTANDIDVITSFVTEFSLSD
jgi:hypothetical protein